MEKLCTHPNVGGALLVSLGCEGFNKRQLAKAVAASGRPVQTLGIRRGLPFQNSSQPVVRG